VKRRSLWAGDTRRRVMKRPSRPEVVFPGSQIVAPIVETRWSPTGAPCRMDDIGSYGAGRCGDHCLNLPWLPEGPGRWAQNQERLTYEMSLQRPILDISPTRGGGYLERERAMLSSAGWTFGGATGYWGPPS